MLLNAEQLAAVNAGPGYWCLLSGPGSGKTRVLVERYNRLVAAGEDPSDILCLTFTRKAAEEMRERARASTAWDGKPCGFRTFHSLAYIFNTTVEPENSLIWDAPDDPYAAWLTNMVHIMKSYPKIRVAWQPKWVMVDEANDLTLEQVELLKLLTAVNGNLFIVGDAAQAIYGFAGATPDILVHFDQYFPDGQTLTMGTNYRSTKAIVDFCRRLAPIQTELLDRLNTSNEQGEAPTFRQYSTNIREAYGVATGMNLNEDNVVLARTNRQLDIFKQWGIPALSIHRSKGLQFDHVWVVGCQDGYLPLTGADEEEEKRLAFVAASRAAKTLHLSCYGTPSKFIQPFLEDGTIRRV